MTANRRLKRRIRARAAKTGESYSAARRHLLQTKELQMRTHELTQAGLTDIGNVRTANEDHLLVEGDLFLVADGMGGHGHGEVASRAAGEQVRSAFADDPTEAGLVAAVKQANATVFQRSQAEGGEATMGTTIAAVARVVDDGREYLAVVNVGDSRVYLLRNRRLTRLTMDHSRVAELVRSGQLSEEAAAVHPERHILTMAVGVGEHIEPFSTRAEPWQGDRLLLCSDGLTNELTPAEITEVLTTIEDPERAAAALVDQAKARGGNDNITVLVVDVS